MLRNYIAAALLCACLLPAAHADFDSALAAYQKKDFAAAHVEFRRLAELGDAPSQRNLAAMYARGEDVAADMVTAWAWAALAAETDPESVPLRDVISKRLTDAQTQSAEQQRAALRESYGPDAVRRRLLPIPAEREADCTVDVRSEAKIMKRVTPDYPRQAAQGGIEGEACMAFYLTRSGQAARASIKSAKATNRDQPSDNKLERYAQAFSESALKSLKKSSFVPPATEALREVPVGYCVRYLLEGASRSEINQVKQLEQQASEGNAKSQFELAQVAESMSRWPKVAKRDQKRLAKAAHEHYLQSAVGGYGPSQFFVARQLLTGDQCEKEEDKGLAWLQFAAQQGHTEAQYLLASRLLYGDGVKAEPDKALTWLEAAAKGGHERARVELARYWLLHNPERRQEALALLSAQPAPNDIGELEIAALAAAHRDDFAQAASYQREALAIAIELDFLLEDRRRLLTAFEARKLPPDLSAPPAN